MVQLVEMRLNTINADLPPAETKETEYTGIQNVQFRNGFAQRSNGWEPIFPTVPEAPQWLLNVQRGGVNYWIAGCKGGVYLTDTNSWTDVTPAGFTDATAPNQWTGGLLNGIPCMNLANDTSVPIYLDWSVPIMLDLPGWPANTTCKALRAHKFHLFAMNITESSVELPDKLLWSDAAAAGNVPDSWAATPTNDAGDTTLAATANPIIDGSTLRGQFMIYKRSSTYLANYVGGTFVYAFRKLYSTSGILARNCVEEYEGKAYVLTDGDAYVHDGQNLHSLLQGRAKSIIFNQIDDVAWQYSYVAVDKKNQEILFCLAPQNEAVPTVAVTYTVNTDSIGARDIGSANHMASGIVSEQGSSEQWDDDSQAWNLDVTVWNETFFNASQDGMLIASEADFQIYNLDASITQDGEPISCVIRKSYWDFNSPELYKLVSRVWPRVTAPADVLIHVRVGSARTANDSVQWSPAVDFNPNADQYVDLFSNGRFMSFEFSSNGGQSFQLDGFDVELDMAGRF